MKSRVHPISRRFVPAALLAAALAGCAGDDSLTDPSPDDLDRGLEGRDDLEGHDDPARPAEVMTATRARGTLPGGNATGVHGCVLGSGGASQYEEPPAPGTTQLHVVGVFTSRGTANTGRRGNIRIGVTRPGRSVLVLSAFETTRWVVTADPGVTLERVILNGLAEQSASVPAGVPVEVHSVAQTGESLGDFNAYEWPSYHTTDLVDAAEELTDLTLTSFRGCYESASFQIDQPGELAPPHPVYDRPKPTILSGCEALASESSYCIASTWNGLVMVGLDSGEVCGELWPEIDSKTDHSAGWQGDYLYRCLSDRGIARISVVDGTADIAPIKCEAVTAYAGGLLASVDIGELAPYLVQFATFEDAAMRQPARIFYPFGAFGDSLVVQGDQIYRAPFVGTDVWTTELEDGVSLKAIPLERSPDWMSAMDVTEAGEIAIAESPGIRLYDGSTGRLRRTVSSEFHSGTASGLKCHSGG